MQDVLAERDGERITAVGGMPPKEKDAATVAFEEALVGKLKAILNKPLCSQVLLELEMASRLGRQFLMINEGPASMPRQGFGMGGGMIGGYGGGMYGDDPLGQLVSVPSIGSPPAETWGAGVLRELVAKMGDIGKHPPRVDDLVRAMVDAKKAGMDDVVEKLKQELQQQLAPAGDVDAEFEGDDPPPGLRHVPGAVAAADEHGLSVPLFGGGQS